MKHALKKGRHSLIVVGVFVALACLVLILANVLDLQLAHALYLVQVHYEALLVAVVRLDALSAKYGQMV